MRYEFRPSVLSTLITTMKAIEVRTETGALVGTISRGTITGAETAGTFCFEPEGATPTTVGVGSFSRSWLKRLVRPDYLVRRNEREDRLSDRLGEKLLYFAVDGRIDSHDYLARQDWDDSVEVKVDGALAARWNIDDLSGTVTIDADPEGMIADPASTLFAVTVLLPFMQMIHADESELIESILE